LNGDDAITIVGRRRFLLLGLGGGAAALVGGTTVRAAAETATVVSVWRLSADWGYAVPPKSRTRCRCQSCRNHAANKVFASKAVALANRIHPCCVCQPYSIDLLAADAATLFDASPSGDSIDLRHDESRIRFEAAMVRSLAPVPPLAPPTVPDPSVDRPTLPPTTPSASPPLEPEPDLLRGALITSTDPARATTSTDPGSATLPVTGGDHATLLTAATVLVAAGVAAIAAASAGNPSA
jgi:hypothetical protein